MMTRDEALALKKRVEDLIEDARTMKDNGDCFGAVNWADIRCVDIERVESLLYPGDPIINVTIGEADAYSRLTYWLTYAIGIPNVHVIGEW